MISAHDAVQRVRRAVPPARLRPDRGRQPGPDRAHHGLLPAAAGGGGARVAAAQAAARVGHLRAELNARAAAMFALFNLAELAACLEQAAQGKTSSAGWRAGALRRSVCLSRPLALREAGRRGGRAAAPGGRARRRTGVTFEGPRTLSALALAVEDGDGATHSWPRARRSSGPAASATTRSISIQTPSRSASSSASPTRSSDTPWRSRTTRGRSRCRGRISMSRAGRALPLWAAETRRRGQGRARAPRGGSRAPGCASPCRRSRPHSPGGKAEPKLAPRRWRLVADQKLVRQRTGCEAARDPGRFERTGLKSSYWLSLMGERTGSDRSLLRSRPAVLKLGRPMRG